MKKLPLEEQKKIRKEREKAGLQEYKKSLRPKEKGIYRKALKKSEREQ